jgi:hypothetical protein
MLAENLFCEKRAESVTRAILQLIKCCQRLDTALATWCDTVPENWKYTSRPRGKSTPDDFDSETSEVYTENVDIYPDVWTAKTWNSYRTTRILVQAIILRSVAWLAECDSPNPRVIPHMGLALQARQIVQQMVYEICACVPFHLGRSTKIGDKPFTIMTNSPEDQTTENLGGYFILWPLYLARSTRMIPNEQKRWITARILHVARHLGFDEELVWTKLNEPPAQVLFGAATTSDSFNQ